MPDFVKVIPGIIQWGLVPLLAVGILGFGVLIEPNDARLKSSTTAGKWAGAIIFVLFVMSQRNPTPPASLSVTTFDIDPIPLAIAIVASFVLAKTLNLVLNTRLAGLLALLLIAASLITLYAYFFIPSYRGVTLFVTVGSALGALLEVLVFERDVIQKRTEEG
jgi:hypothetical protein